MSRFLFIAVWTLSLALVPLIVFAVFLFVLKWVYPDPPTELAFGLGTLSTFVGVPIFGLGGLILGLIGLLPGTKKRKTTLQIDR